MPPSSPSRFNVRQHLSGRHFEDQHLVVVQSGRQGGIIGAPGQLPDFRSIRMKDLVRIFGVRGPEENVRSTSGQRFPVRRPRGTPATAIAVEMRWASFPRIPDASALVARNTHRPPLRLAGHRWTMRLGCGREDRTIVTGGSTLHRIPSIQAILETAVAYCRPSGEMQMPVFRH